MPNRTRVPAGTCRGRCRWHTCPGTHRRDRTEPSRRGPHESTDHRPVAIRVPSAVRVSSTAGSATPARASRRRRPPCHGTHVRAAGRRPGDGTGDGGRGGQAPPRRTGLTRGSRSIAGPRHGARESSARKPAPAADRAQRWHRHRDTYDSGPGHRRHRHPDTGEPGQGPGSTGDTPHLLVLHEQVRGRVEDERMRRTRPNSPGAPSRGQAEQRHPRASRPPAGRGDCR